MTEVYAEKRAAWDWIEENRGRLSDFHQEIWHYAKPVHAAKGYYDDLDAAISYHPYPTNTTVWDTHCGTYWSCVFTFECLEPEIWIDQRLLAHPDRLHAAARAPAAIDAVTLMYTTT